MQTTAFLGVIIYFGKLLRNYEKLWTPKTLEIWATLKGLILVFHKKISVILLIYEGKVLYQKIFVQSYIRHMFLRDSKIVNLIKNRFLPQALKIKLKNWNWIGIYYAVQMTASPKLCSYGNIFARNYLSHLSLNYNRFHNNFRLFDVLQNFPFTLSETIGDYYL